jgi:EF-P beta-lysylation protein EpmB
MIHQANVRVESQWQKELKQSFTTPELLLEYLGFSPENFNKDIAARELFNMRVPVHFANLMQKKDVNDPLFKQVFPSYSEFNSSPEYVIDPLLEQSNSTPGLLHKYKSRVLIIFKGGCAVNCRYCFRRHFPYADNSVNKKQLLAHLEYIKQHEEINEVILSGGDPLMADDKAIEWFLTALADIGHITRVRIHTRLPVVIPSRITYELLNTFSQTNLNVILVMHINHANEISDELKEVCLKLKRANVILLNQAVLLKDVNDGLQAQVNLSEALFNVGILPYYLHLLDKVSGAMHFDISEEKAKALYSEMLAELPGFLMPKLVREIGGERSKTPILP